MKTENWKKKFRRNYLREHQTKGTKALGMD
jgi:hypothetical protein